MKYCKVAYTANLRHFKGAIAKEMSGLKMYKRLADGRHEGLVELPLESADAFKHRTGRLFAVCVAPSPWLWAFMRFSRFVVDPT